MDVKLRIIDAAMTLMNLLEHYGDEQLAEMVCEAIYNYDLGTLLDLEDTLEE